MLSSLAIAAPRCHALCTAVRCNSFSGFSVFPDISLPRAHSFSLPLCLAQTQFFPPLSSPPLLLAESSQFIPMPQVQPPDSSRAEGQDLELRGGRTRAACSPRANGQRPCGRSALPHAAAHAGPLAYRAAQQLQASRASAAALASAQCALSLLTVSPCTCLCGRASGPAAGGTCGVNRGRRRASSPPDAAAVLFLQLSGAPPPALRRASTTSSCLLRITI